MYSDKVKSLKVGQSVMIKGLLGPLKDDGDRDFKVRADPHWNAGVYTTAVQGIDGDEEGLTEIAFTIVEFYDEPNGGLMVVQAHGRKDPSSVPYVAVDGGPTFIVASLIKADTLTASGLIYPKELLEKAIKEYNDKPTKLSHVDADGTRIDNVQGTAELKLSEDGIVYGDVELLDTPQGEHIRKLLDAGARVGLSILGTGTPRELQTPERPSVVEDYRVESVGVHPVSKRDEELYSMKPIPADPKALPCACHDDTVVCIIHEE